MIDENILNYLNTYILKKGEKLDFDQITRTGDPFIDIPIVKSTKRTFRKLGFITIGNAPAETNDRDIDTTLKKLKLTPRKRLRLDDDDPQILQWLEDGWILKEIRLKQDGKTLDSQNYRMGYRLFKHERDIKEQQEEQIRNELEHLNKEFIHVNMPPNQPFIKQTMFNHMKEKYLSVCDKAVLNESEFFPKNWTFKKRMRFLHFILALVQIGSAKQQIDWKEIGASYYKEIGGSKVFDQNQDEFLELLEEWSGYPAVEFGLTSLGHITPIFFSGQLDGMYSSFNYGPVHAVTNLSLTKEQFQTNATTLWIVENRGIVTRLASQKDFLEKTSTLTLCCDGHIRSAHRHFIQQMMQYSNLNQVIIWTDYDPDGMIIAQELYKIVKKDVPSIKWISPNGDILKNWTDYEQTTKKFLEKRTMEQEEMTGDVTRWKKWITS